MELITDYARLDSRHRATQFERMKRFRATTGGENIEKVHHFLEEEMG